LDGVENDQPKALPAAQIGQVPRWNLNDRKDALGGFGLGRAGKLTLAYLTRFDPALAQRCAQRLTSRGAVELRRGEHADDLKLRFQQLFVRADSFHNEISLPLAGATTSEIASER
jgi:hypothetical protein